MLLSRVIGGRKAAELEVIFPEKGNAPVFLGSERKERNRGKEREWEGGWEAGRDGGRKGGKKGRKERRKEGRTVNTKERHSPTHSDFAFMVLVSHQFRSTFLRSFTFLLKNAGNHRVTVFIFSVELPTIIPWPISDRS